MGKPKGGKEVTSVLVPTSNRRKQEKILRKYYEQGWTLTLIRLGGGWTKSTAWLEREVQR